MMLNARRNLLVSEQASKQCLSKIGFFKKLDIVSSSSETRYQHRLVLILFAITTLFCLLTSQAQAQVVDQADDRPIIMCQTLPPYWHDKDQAGKPVFYLSSPIYREVARQLVLNVFREEFGLPTRDESLLEPIDLDSDHLFEIDVKVIEMDYLELIIRHKAKEVFSEKLAIKLNLIDGHKCATVLEKKLKPGLIAAIEKLGYHKDERVFERTDEYTPLPDEMERKLRSMNHISQFLVVRELHELIRRDGPTVSRLCGLVRGYSNLSQLTCSTLDFRSGVFAARAMLYARRLRRFSKNSVHSICTDAYSEIMLGYPNRAWGHVKGTPERFAAKNLEPFDWLTLLDDYIHYRDSKIEEVMTDDDSTLSEIAALLRFRSGLQSEMSTSAFSKEHAGELALEVIPTCQWIYDRLSYGAGVASSHRWTSQAPEELSSQLADYLSDWNGLPVETTEMIDEVIADGGFDIYSTSKVANQLIEDAKHDRGEPSLAVLGRNIEAWNVMHVVRIARFHRNGLAIEPNRVLNQLEFVYENHPSAVLIRAIGIKSDFKNSDPAYLERLGGSLKNFEYKHPNIMADQQLLRQLHPMFKFANNVSLSDAIEVSFRSNRAPEYNFCRYAAYSLASAYSMKEISRRSPVRMAKLFTGDWEKNKQDFDAWVTEFSESPATLLTAARVYREHLKDFKKSIDFYNKYLENSPDAAVIKELARLQFDQAKTDDWQKTLIRVFDTGDLGLQHSNTAAALAATLMIDGDYDAALQWAERANQSGSSLGMSVLEQCRAGLGDLDRASDIGRQRVVRYGSYNSVPTYAWFMWCGANKHEDLDEAWSELQEAFKTHYGPQKAAELIANNKIYYDLFKGDLKQAAADLEEDAKRTGNVLSGMKLVIYSDQANDTKTRDDYLERFITGAKKPNFYSALAKLLQKYFKTKKYDRPATLALFKKFPVSEWERIDIYHLLIITRLKHEGDELHEKIKRYLTKILKQHGLKPGVRALHHLTLTSLGESPVYLLESVDAEAWVRVVPGELTEEQKAREEERQKTLQEQILRAREYEFDPKKKRSKRDAKKEKAKAK